MRPNKQVNKLVPDSETLDPSLGAQLDRYGEPSELRGLLEQEGFRDFKVEDFEFDLGLGTSGESAWAVYKGFVLQILSTLREEKFIPTTVDIEAQGKEAFLEAFQGLRNGEKTKIKIYSAVKPGTSWFGA
mmetsp:Transcript_49119/g.76607  ORF Transcript_49119/g.76607 Transcript_49119/m.76607 type:complete len:130 (-) Transcript_49119:137-526(-)|eukprot:CAMPEP_0184309406 /NCGR_PEP_ID=MMETSP1049-20130417/17579_1 /TAXON_ID=77928 /ORGANISM="Proteomonas sulcata, Strain CCMP704" /LENGTH=129 /DNA_ID=CAMNT_0026622285 /DNA_START=588 /DNA_END=977 /DNA_ORIENTATION=+